MAWPGDEDDVDVWKWFEVFLTETIFFVNRVAVRDLGAKPAGNWSQQSSAGVIFWWVGDQQSNKKNEHRKTHPIYNSRSTAPWRPICYLWPHCSKWTLTCFRTGFSVSRGGLAARLRQSLRQACASLRTASVSCEQLLNPPKARFCRAVLAWLMDYK